ncbi:MAG: SIMPL domain-containing protein [Desulfobacterales bacterium]|nr:SIMPL domain-containing protein [Desulfobacterales bacterium]
MKKIFIIGLLFIFMLSVPAWAFSDKPYVSVVGTGFVEVVPDEMYWNLRIENSGQEIKPLSSLQGEVVAGVISFLKASKIPEKEIQTTRPQIGERWSHHKGRRVKDGYYAASTISFKLTDFSQYQNLWEKLTEFKGMNIQDVAYGYSKKIEAQAKARTLALTDARDKAKQMAQTLACDIGTPFMIEESSGNSGVFRKNMLMAAEADMGGRGQQSYAPGQIKIENRVKVVFSLVCE